MSDIASGAVSVKLTQAELDRAAMLQECIAGRLKNGQAAEQLGLSRRQLKRLKHAFKQEGAKGLASKKRGRPSPNQLPEETKVRATHLLHTYYADFGPTLAHEKLSEVHHLILSCESVRQLMMQEGLWKPQRARQAVIHQLRLRRARRGELVQLDGSPFDWFEGRAPACTLLVCIDDATNDLLELFFTAAETTHSYGCRSTAFGFQATEGYLLQYGRPVAFYSDKLGVFRINHPNALEGAGTTQFGRALYELDIALICAHTPPAKGRVERTNRLLQDRLVKELRLCGISAMETANAYLPQLRAELNRRFAVAPRDLEDAHRPLRATDDLARIYGGPRVAHVVQELDLELQQRGVSDPDRTTDVWLAACPSGSARAVGWPTRDQLQGQAAGVYRVSRTAAPRGAHHQ